MSEERLRAVIRGSVQGVGFRAFATRQAAALGLTGYVKNEYDGSVTIVAEGRREDLETFLENIGEGPGSASVRDVEASWSEASGEFSDFGVRF